MIKLKHILNEDYSQRARNFRVALRRRLAAMKSGGKISYGKLSWTALGNGNFKDSKGRTVPGQDIVQDLKRAVQSDIMQHRGAAGDDMVNAYLKFEGKLNEAGDYKDVSNKFKNALDVMPEKYFNRKGIEALIKKLKEKRPDAAMAYAMDAFGWMSGMKK